MSNRFEYKVVVVRLFFNLLSINVLLAIIFFLSHNELQINSELIVFGIINISYFATVISRPYQIIIDQEKLLLEIHYVLGFLKKQKILPLREVICSFNHEVRARGGKVKVLRIMYENKSVVELLPDYNGWNENILTQIFEKLKNEPR